MRLDRPFHLDSRTDAEGLWHRAGIEAADVIDRDGLAVSNISVCMPGVDLRRARLPHREYLGNSGKRAGAAVVGTRERQLDGDVLRDDGSIEIGKWRALPASRAEIVAKLLGESGLIHAPHVVLKLGGWPVDYAFDGLHRLHRNDAESQALVAARLGDAAIRQMALLVISEDEHDIVRVGASRVVRAAIDAAVALMNVVDVAPTGDAIGQQLRGKLAGRLVHLLNSLTEKLETAATFSDARRRLARLKALIKVAQSFTDAIGRFTFASGRMTDRVKTLIHSLAKDGKQPNSVADWALAVASMNARVCAAVPGRAKPDWPYPYVTGVMAGLELADSSARQAGIAWVRCDFIYALIITRRLDRVYDVMPWLCVPSASFPLVFGGFVGAVAQLFEAARAMEIALELKRRLFDADDSDRLDKKKARKAYATPRSVAQSVFRRRGAGFLLAEAATSHHMVEAFIGGAQLDARHPIPVALAGRLNWSFSRSIRDLSTADSTGTGALAGAAFETTSYDKDVPRYMGMSLIEMLCCALCEIFTATRRGTGYSLHRGSESDDNGADVDADDDFTGTEGIRRAHRQAMRSMLRTLDISVTDVAAIAAQEGDGLITVRTIEVDRLNSLKEEHLTREQEQTAQGLRRQGCRLANSRATRAHALRDLVDVARIPVSARSKIPAADEPLAKILRGEVGLRGSAPIAHVFYHVLWFRPNIDSEILGWLAQLGAPSVRPPGTSDSKLLSVRAKIAALEARAENGINLAAPIGRTIRTLVPMFTGLTGITADTAHFAGLTSHAQKKASEDRIVDNDEGTNDDVAAATRRTGTQDQDQGRDGRSLDRSGLTVQSALPGAARSGGHFGAGSRIEGCRTDQRRARGRGS